jgi:hypothetical protein
VTHTTTSTRIGTVTGSKGGAVTDQARRPRPLHCFNDAGSSSVTMAIIFPAVAALVMALAQAAMVAAARNVALAAAEEGLRTARARDATPAQGKAAATAFARHEPVLISPTVTVTDGTTIEVAVNGQAPSLLPGVQLAIHEAAHGAHERFTEETRGFTLSIAPSGPNLEAVTSGG